MSLWCVSHHIVTLTVLVPLLTQRVTYMHTQKNSLWYVSHHIVTLTVLVPLLALDIMGPCVKGPCVMGPCVTGGFVTAMTKL